jgi:arylsulfatase A-like enzyme
VDALARDGARFENVYASDVPCLPSRSALLFGRFGIHTGVVNHGGTAADPFPLGPRRGFIGPEGYETIFRALRGVPYRTASVSSFPARHAAPWWTSGLADWINPGGAGHEIAPAVNAAARPWLERHAREDNWFLHLNYWDPHTPYRTPDSYPNPFEHDPPPAWHTEAVRSEHWAGFGPNSAQDAPSVWAPPAHTRAGVPVQIASEPDWKAWIDAYDTGIRFMDDHLSEVLGWLEAAGVLEETLVVVSADHGEMQGEMNVYGDHQAADQFTCRVPFVIRGPGFRGGRVDAGLHYQFDLGATVLEACGVAVPRGWDGRGFLRAFLAGEETGRDHLVLSQMAWACQRAVRFGDHLLVRTYHDGFRDAPPVALYNLAGDPHERTNLADALPAVRDRGLALLEAWQFEMLATATAPSAQDPMFTVLREGGPSQLHGRLGSYARRLRDTGRAHHADALERRHGGAP